jgi:HK97 family phage prohead protease
VIDGIETRKINGVTLERTYDAKYEIRALAGSKVELEGYASTYERAYKMYDQFGPYEEVARSGMCSKTLSENAAVAYLANHTGLTLCSTEAGTLRISEDSTGLHTVGTFNTARSDVRDLILAVEDGDIREMSFAFRVIRQNWSPDYDQRDLIEVDLNRGDVSAVNFGANPLTSVAAVQRSFRKFSAAKKQRMATEVREGKTLSAATAEVVAQVLDLCARADDAMDQAQPLLANLIGVANPDDDGENEAEAARALAYLDVLRRKHEHEVEASRLIVGF